MINAAIDRYHGLLTDSAAAEANDMMQAQLKPRRLHFGTVPVCRVLRPHFYLEEDWAYLKRETEVILSAFAKAHDACMHDAKLREQLALESYEEQLLHLDANVSVPWSSSRLDSFFRPEANYLRFVEYNAETPAGLGYNDELVELFLSLPVMRAFQEYYDVTPTRGLGQLTTVLLRAYRAWGGKAARPQIAIADWQEVPTLNEHHITRDYFEAQGYPAVLVDPRELEFRGGQLWAGDFHVDIIYKRVLHSELVQRMGIDNPLVQAVRAGAAMITNSFSAKLMAKKASLAFLSDEQNAYLFTPRERASVAVHIPWTRIVADRRTFYEGREVDLLPFISKHREYMVIKPNDEYGGSGVVLGWEVSQEQWDAAIRHAQTTPHVVQERVNLIQRDFPMMIDNHLDISPRFIDANPYVFWGETVGGVLTRLSAASLLNVTAGTGSVVPMFVIRKKA